MNKNGIIIVGVALLGIGAILYFRLKKTDSEDSLLIEKSGEKDNSNPLNSEEVAIKVTNASRIVEKICELKKTYKITLNEINDYMNFDNFFGNDIFSGIGIKKDLIGVGLKNVQYKNRRKEAIETISKLILELKELGYIEVDCKLVKIAEAL